MVQDTHLRLVGLGPSAHVAHLRAFLFRVASNLAIDLLRRRYTRSTYEVTDVVSEEIVCPVERAIDAQVQVLRQAIVELPAKCREVFLLHKTQHLTYSEIAARLRISKSAVEKHMSKALAFCRDPLEEGIRTSGISGRYEPEEALRLLLNESGLTYRFTDANTVTLEQAPAQPAPAPAARSKATVINEWLSSERAGSDQAGQVAGDHREGGART